MKICKMIRASIRNSLWTVSTIQLPLLFKIVNDCRKETEENRHLNAGRMRIDSHYQMLLHNRKVEVLCLGMIKAIQELPDERCCPGLNQGQSLRPCQRWESFSHTANENSENSQRWIRLFKKPLVTVHVHLLVVAVGQENRFRRQDRIRRHPPYYWRCQWQLRSWQDRTQIWQIVDRWHDLQHSKYNNFSSKYVPTTWSSRRISRWKWTRCSRNRCVGNKLSVNLRDFGVHGSFAARLAVDDAWQDERWFRNWWLGENIRSG